MSWDKFFDFVINKSHVFIICLCQAAIMVMHYHYGKDISDHVQTTVSWFYGVLGGHFVGSQIWPDKGGQ